MTDRSTVAAEIAAAVGDAGVEHAFCVPGESYLATLQAIGESARTTLVSARHEEGAGLMAEAYAKATGRPGVCLVTRGPGLTHLSIALHTARQDSTPLLAVVGQVPTSVRYREAFQELDIVEFCRPVSKWAAELTDADRVPELVQKALFIATEGRPGPVVLSLPEDVDRADCARPPAPAVTRLAALGAEALTSAVEMLRSAQRPCIIAGGGVTAAGANDELVRLAEALGAPVYSGWRRFDVFPNSHPLYLGPLPAMPSALYAPLREADLVVALGTRLDEFTTLYYQVPGRHQNLLLLGEQPSATEAFNQASRSLVLTGSAGSAIGQLADALDSGPVGAADVAGVTAARAAYVQATTPRPRGPEAAPVDPEAILATITDVLPADTAITSDAGTFAGWMGRFYKWDRPRTFFAPTAGGMGYALPAAIGAKLAEPDRAVVAFAGDGGFAMTMSELETAVRLGLERFVVLVFDNAAYGTIMKHQYNAGMRGEIGTRLTAVDFATVAAGLGAYGARISTTDQFGAEFAKALDAGLAVLQIILENDSMDPWASYRGVA